MDVVKGRATDVIVLPDGTIKHALSVIYPLRDIDGLRRFRVVQQQDYSVTIEYVPDDQHSRLEMDL